MHIFYRVPTTCGHLRQPDKLRELKIGNALLER
jgi:hypothetical protein